jgi:hypothetical protein
VGCLMQGNGKQHGKGVDRDGLNNLGGIHEHGVYRVP